MAFQARLLVRCASALAQRAASFKQPSVPQILAPGQQAPMPELRDVVHEGNRWLEEGIYWLCDQADGRYPALIFSVCF